MISIFGFGKKKYNDQQIMKQVRRAIDAHPMIKKNQNFSASSSNGVIKLEGKVKSDTEKKRIEHAIKSKIDQLGFQYDKIENEIEIEE